MTVKSRVTRQYSRMAIALAALATALAISCGGEESQSPVPDVVATPVAGPGSSATALSQSPAAGTVSTTPFVVNVSIGDLEISPSTMAVPVGRPVLLVVRNRGIKEHGYHIDGLQPKDMIWFELLPEGLEPTAAVDHTDSEHQATGPTKPDAETLAVLDEHAAHHDNWAMVPHRVCDVQTAGCGHGGHVQVQMSPGETAFLMFIPDSAGRHGVMDLTNPDLSATLVVF